MNAACTVAGLLHPGALTFGTPQTVGALTLVPVGHSGAAAEYVLHGELPAGAVTLREAGGGVVAQLEVVNHTGHRVLLVEGQMIDGLKQTRTLNVTVLVPAHSTLTIPVSCVEAGRWDPAARPAGAGAFHVSPRVRHTTTRGVQASLRAGAGYRSEQSAVWAHVDERLARHGAAAPTRSYAEIHRRRGADIRRMIDGMAPEPGQCGVLALVGHRPAALDVFDRPATLTALWRSLAGSYAADAVAEAGWADDRHVEEAVGWVHELAAGAGDEYPAPGDGTVVQLAGRRGLVSALVAGGVVVHLAALWLPDPGRSESSHPMQRAGGQRAWFHVSASPAPRTARGGDPAP